MKIIRLLLTVMCIAVIITTSGCYAKKASIEQTNKETAQKTSTEQTNKETVIISSDYPKYSAVEDLTNKATLIIKGTILGSKVEELNDLITSNTQDEKLNPGGNPSPSLNVYTVYTVKVKDSYKGNVNPGDTVEVKIRGGEINNKTYIYDNGMNFANNKSYIMFLETYPNSPACLLNPIQAAYTDTKDEKGNFNSAHLKNNLKLSEQYLEQIKKAKK